MNETIARLERDLSQAPTELDKACAASLLAWELRLVDSVRAITLSDETAELLRNLLAESSALLQADQFNAQTALATCLRTKAWCVYRLADYDLAHRIIKEALAELNKTDDIEGEAHAYLILGNSAWRLGDYDEALDAFNACIERARQTENHKLEADALGNIGLVYQNLSDYRASLDYHQRCLDIQRRINDKQGLARTHSNIGTVYFIIADYSSAMEYFHRSLILSQELGDTRSEAIAEGNIGDVYFHLGDYVSALDIYQKSLSLFQNISDRYGEASSLSNIGSIYDKLGDSQAALAFQTDALSLFRSIAYPAGEINALLAMGVLYERTRNYGEAKICFQDAAFLAHRIGDRYSEADALYHQGILTLSSNEATSSDYQDSILLLKTALNTAEKIDARELVYKSHKALSEIYKRRREFEDALKHHEEFYRLRESVFNTESDKRLRSLQVMHQLEQMRRESTLFQKQAEDLKQANEALSAVLLEMEQHKKNAEEANRFKSHLLSIAAHDLRNPLSTIVTITDFVQSIVTSVKNGDSLSQLAEAEGLLNLIHDSSTRMFKLIAQILQSSQIDSGKLQLSRVLADLYPIALSAVQENLSQAERKEQKILFSGDSDLFAHVDADCIREIFDNLISNAVKYSPKGKKIEVKICHHQPPDMREKTIIFSVHDEGQGLTSDDMKKLFGKFERLSAKPTGGEPSTGLGLSIVKQLAELHDGKVWAESAGKNHGATFFVELPAHQPA
jgi:signal transduction histidine kinase